LDVMNNFKSKRQPLRAFVILKVFWRLERVTGIEPVRSAWEADRLPLHHTRSRAAKPLRTNSNSSSS